MPHNCAAVALRQRQNPDRPEGGFAADESYKPAQTTQYNHDQRGYRHTLEINIRPASPAPRFCQSALAVVRHKTAPFTVASAAPVWQRKRYVETRRAARRAFPSAP